ncbi:MAG: YfcE family phosphodiesterase [Sulfurimonas sp.]|nr:MAG: YfcE family phosphodiesterase [Sulfurimonas sp.]
MKIGIISDTHKRVKRAARAINVLINDGAEFIIHAGDIVELDILELLKNCGIKYVAVYGNNDSHLAEQHSNYNLVQEPYYFKLKDTRFKLMHLPFYLTPDADVVISGHTHIFHSEFKKPTLFLNPGEVCGRNKPISEWIMLDIEKITKKEYFYDR